MAERPAFDPLSVSTLEFWSGTAEQRDTTFRELRDERPLSWHPPMEGALMEAEQDGFWAVVRHEDVVAVSKNPALFCSGQGVMMEEVPADLLEASQSFLAMDAPRHGALRRLISSAFTPRRIAAIETQIHEQARLIVDDLLATDSGDFVEQVSKRLPMWTINEMIGLPAELREEAAHNADGMVSWNDAEVAAGREPLEVLTDSLFGLLATCFAQIEERREHPGDDLLTNLVQAEVDGERLTDEEIASFFVLLSVAGNDTSRNSITLGMKALSDHPGQRKLWADDVPGLMRTGIDEVLRWATPVMTFRRTATQDTVLGGQQIRAGDWLTTIFSSANRDDRAFDHPEEFDITRSPNPHLAFGGGGPHFCMGNALARTQLSAIFGQLLERAPTLTLGEPDYLTGNFVRAVKTLPYTL